jgi:hypothetical protein
MKGEQELNMTLDRIDATPGANGLREATPAELSSVAGGFRFALPLIVARIAQILSAGTAPYRPTDPS